jgi:type II secretory pathway component GspD/PulD (secretin)
LGDLFKSNYQELRQKELLIYITPYVLNLDGETFREEMYTKEKEYEGLIQEIN